MRYHSTVLRLRLDVFISENKNNHLMITYIVCTLYTRDHRPLHSRKNDNISELDGSGMSTKAQLAT